MNGNSTNGPTPLTEAVDDSLTDVVKFLVGAGADPNIPDEVTDPLPLPHTGY